MYKFACHYEVATACPGITERKVVFVSGPSAYDVRAWCRSKLHMDPIRLETVLDSIVCHHEAEAIARTQTQLAQEHAASLLEQGRREGRMEACELALEVVRSFKLDPRLSRKLVNAIQRAIPCPVPSKD